MQSWVITIIHIQYRVSNRGLSIPKFTMFLVSLALEGGRFFPPLFHQPVPDGITQQLSPALQIEFGHDVLQVRLHGIGADH